MKIAELYYNIVTDDITVTIKIPFYYRRYAKVHEIGFMARYVSRSKKIRYGPCPYKTDERKIAWHAGYRHAVKVFDVANFKHLVFER